MSNETFTNMIMQRYKDSIIFEQDLQCKLILNKGVQQIKNPRVIYYLGEGVTGAPREDRYEFGREISSKDMYIILNNKIISTIYADNTFDEKYYAISFNSEMEAVYIPKELIGISVSNHGNDCRIIVTINLE